MVLVALASACVSSLLSAVIVAYYSMNQDDVAKQLLLDDIAKNLMGITLSLMLVLSGYLIIGAVV